MLSSFRKNRKKNKETLFFR